MRRVRLLVATLVFGTAIAAVGLVGTVGVVGAADDRSGHPAPQSDFDDRRPATPRSPLDQDEKYSCPELGTDPELIPPHFEAEPELLDQRDPPLVCELPGPTSLLPPEQTSPGR